MRRLALSALALCVSLAVYAATDTLTLGASIQETGPLANTGRYYKDGYQFAIDQVNKMGGVTIAGRKYQLALKDYDDQSDRSLAVRQYVQLLTDDKVNYLLGPFASDFVLATSSVSEKYEVPMVQGGGASDQIFGRGYRYVFGTLPVASKYFDSTINAMKNTLRPEPDRVALLYADDAFDVSVAEGTRPLLKQAGLQLVVDERYSSNASDFSSILSKIKQNNVTAILVSGHETECLNFIRQAKSLAVNPLMYSFTVGVPSADFRHALGSDANYAFGMTPWLPSTELKDTYFGDAAAFAKAWKDKFGYEPDYHCASAVVNVEIYAKALEAAGTTDPKAVRDAIAKVDFDSLYGRIAFQPSGQISLPQVMIQVQNNQLVPVYGQHGAIDKMLFPMPAWNKR